MSLIKVKGKIIFNPVDLTNKHKRQSSWKYIVLIKIFGDVAEYYSYFIKKRFNLELNKPLRGSHITFINDSIYDLKKKLSNYELDEYQKRLKNKYNNNLITVELDTDVRTNGKFWWLNVSKDSKEILYNIRKEILLDKPYFGLHMTIGYANEKNIEHSNYILRCIKKFNL